MTPVPRETCPRSPARGLWAGELSNVQRETRPWRRDPGAAGRRRKRKEKPAAGTPIATIVRHTYASFIA